MSFWCSRGLQFHILHFPLCPPTRIHSIHGCDCICTVHRLRAIHL
ncbi:hypothetical protein BT93_B2252 [Corymbia citriodora subsp. variegata]|nr:hypothetical protein BT93_B2252 [Corymbia citriodora subsp. variegata]